MKKVIVALLIAVIALGGCAKKQAPAPTTDQARKLLMEGTVYLKQSDVANAIKSFAQAIKVAPDYFESYYLLAQTLLHLQQFQQAEALLITTAQRFPDNGVAFYLLSLAHHNAGNTIPAIVAARRSVEIFTAKGDQEGQQRSMILLAALVSEVKKQGEAQAVANAAKEAQDTVQKAGKPAEPEPQTTNALMNSIDVTTP